jgi:prepilin-type N-terminal cleavage/methylation domain-containing protein
MIKRQAGFTMVELIVTMAIFVITIAAVSAIFVPLFNQFKQQSKIAETNIEGMVGLEILRHDIEHAGFGLPWVLQPGLTITSYSEASAVTTSPIPAPNSYNDGGSLPLNPPRGILSDDNVLNGSDYLVIKSTAVGINGAAGKYTDVIGTGGGGSTVKSWGNPADDLNENDRTIVLILSRGENNQRILVNKVAAYTALFKGGTDFPTDYSPGTAGDLFLIYGITNDQTVADLRMPFNRADYYISRVAGTTIPARCAPGTGILMKSVIEQKTGNRGNGIPLLDCVADFQVAFDLDTSIPPDGIIEAHGTEDISGLTAQQIREQVKTVRVYMLAHEGQKDISFTYANTDICVGEVIATGCSPGRSYDLTTITDYTHYRWRVYTLVAQTKNLRN